jgi:hypothetical protein
MQGFNGGPYGSAFLNDIHTFFPAFLYTPERFNSVRDVMMYVSQQMSERYDVYSSWRNYHQRMYAQQSQQQPQQQQRGHRDRERWNSPRQQQQPQQQPQQPQQQSPNLQVQAELDMNALSTDPLTNYFLRTLFYPGNTTTFNTTQPFWDPVVITPTPQQIAAASTTYSAPTALDTPCAICQETIAEGANVRKLSYCNHFFHKTCIDNWFLRDVRCPSCRHDIRARSPNTTAS